MAVSLGAAPGLAHSGGKAVPVVEVRVEESGPLEAIVDLRVRDQDGGEPVRDAEVTGAAKMTSPHTMFTYFGPLPEIGAGRYRARVRLPMTARWELTITVGGADVIPVTLRRGVTIDRSALTEQGRRSAPSAATGVTKPAVIGVVRFEITRREILDMVVLWAHGIAATAWIVGLALLLVSVTAGAGSLAPHARVGLARWYRRWGLPLTWLAAVIVVATGVYNTLRVSPFRLVWRPGDLDQLRSIPYGRTYEAILATKLALFAIMLVAGLVATIRARYRWNEPRAEGGGWARAASSLGVSGLVFLASAPLVVGAVVALRYVHILSHVAEASIP